MALPGSILDNAQSAELRTYLAGQVARALAVFNIDEVIVFNDDNQGGGGNSQLINIDQNLACVFTQNRTVVNTILLFWANIQVIIHFCLCLR